MLERIKEEIYKIESTGIKVLYACESGSRAWGFESKDSDFDVRFIYALPREKYLTVYDFKDTMDFPIDDLLDLNGWDIKKALRLFSGNNMSVYEWLNSPIVYHERDGFAEEIRKVQQDFFNPSRAIGHYLGTAKSTWNKHLTQSTFNIKKLFYALRPIMACRWIIEYKTVPPVCFQDMLIEPLIGKEVSGRIDQLIDEKKFLTEKDISSSYNDLREFVDAQMDEVSQMDVERSGCNDKELIDELFRKFI